METISLGIAIATFVGSVVVAILALTLIKLVEWFRARRKISLTNRDVIGVVLAQRLNEKRFVEIPGVFSNNRAKTQLVQAIYDKRSGQVLDARAVSSGNTSDSDLLQKTSRGDGMIIYT